MERGDVVTVYEDPITKKKEEGEAKLIERLGDTEYNAGNELWIVKFLSDGFICERLVSGQEAI